MKCSELEKDATYILEAFKQRDYEIPSNRQIMKVVFSKLIVVYTLQVFLIVLDVFLNVEGEYYHFFDTIVLSLASNVFFTLVFLMVAYSPVCMRIVLGDELINRSVLLKMIEKKVRFYSVFLLIVNALFGIVLLWAGERFVAGLGFSWFATFVIGVICLQTSLSRYLTPSVVNTLSKVKELISPGINQVKNHE